MGASAVLGGMASCDHIDSTSTGKGRKEEHKELCLGWLTGVCGNSLLIPFVMKWEVVLEV